MESSGDSMAKIETIREFIKKIEGKSVHVIYGAGTVGKIVGEFLKNRNISVAAYTVTILDQKKELK